MPGQILSSSISSSKTIAQVVYRECLATWPTPLRNMERPALRQVHFLSYPMGRPEHREVKRLSQSLLPALLMFRMLRRRAVAGWPASRSQWIRPWCIALHRFLPRALWLPSEAVAWLSSEPS